MAGEKEEGGSFQVSAEEAAKAKASGEYGTPEDKKVESDDDGKKADDDDDGKSIISDEDPGETDDDKGTDDDDADDKSDDKSDDDDDKESTPEEKFAESQLKWTKEFVDTGELSEETRKEIGKSVFAPGVPQEVVDGYLKGYTEGHTAIGAQALASAHEVAGGKEEYTAMANWASTNLSEGEIAAFDADVSGEDIGKRDTAIQGLHARMTLANGLEPNLEPDLSHDGGRGAGEPIIGSRQELAKIQATAAYKSDPAVRAKVERQLRQSRATGKYRTS